MKPQDTIANDERNFSIKETAAWANISLPTLWRRVKCGDLPVVYIGSKPVTTPEGRAQFKATWTRKAA